MKPLTGPGIPHGLTATSGASAGAMKATPRKSWSPNSALLSSAADLELTPEVREDHTAYIESWLKVLKQDKRAIFTAAAHAQRAVDFLHGLPAGCRAGGRRVGSSADILHAPPPRARLPGKESPSSDLARFR